MYPRTDIENSEPIARSIASLDDMPGLHRVVERDNPVFAISHTALGIRVKEMSYEPRQVEAILLGAESYEVFSSVVGRPTRLGEVEASEIVFSYYKPVDIVDMALLMEESSQALRSETPQTAEAVALLTAERIGDSGSELRRLALCGAGVVRAAHLQAVEIQAFGAFLEEGM